MRKSAAFLRSSLILILLGLASSENIQDGIEASGEPDNTKASTPYDLIDPESSGDGIGDIDNTAAKVDIISDISDQGIFANDSLIAIANVGNMETRNESSVISDFSTTTQADTSPATTEMPTTSQEPTTSMHTTEVPTTTADVPLETTEKETTIETTTVKQSTAALTTERIPANRVTTTRGPTTRRTTVSKAWKATTKSPETSTVSSTTESVTQEQACLFTDSDFVCDLEMDCVGEGVVDCINIDDKVETTTDAMPHGAIDSEDYADEEDAESLEDTNVLSGRIHSIKSPALLWKIQSMSTAPSETTTTTTTTTATTTTSGTLNFLKHLVNSNKFAGTASTNRNVASGSPTLPPDYTQTPTIETVAGTDVTTEKIDPSSTTPESDVLETKPTYGSDIEESTEVPLKTETPPAESINKGNVAGIYNSTPLPVAENTDMLPESSATAEGLFTDLDRSARKRRSDEQSKADHVRTATSGSQNSQEFNKGPSVVRRCKIIGNLKCNPSPTTSFCKGIGTCKVPEEKTDKSTSEKKVENWAIIVIAICATAAALTVSLLIYLVISSWKKLKVQPQNGVTTLTYVNSTPP